MRLVVAVPVLAFLLAGCTVPTEPEDLPAIDAERPFGAVLSVVAAAETLALCDPQAMPREEAVCHETQVKVTNPLRVREVAVGEGWSAVTAAGGVYAGRVASGPAAVVAGGEGVLRLRFAVGDGSNLTHVRWTPAEGGDPVLQAPVPAYLDLSTLLPPIELVGAEHTYGGCWHMGSCTTAVLAVDNRAGAQDFPAADAVWFIEGSDPAYAWGLAVQGLVPAGEAGNVTVEVDHWAATRVAVALDGWTVPAFALPHPSELPVRDEGGDLDVFQLMQVGQPTTNRTSGGREVLLAAQPMSMHNCAPFRGEVAFVLERQAALVLDVDPLWQTVRAWNVTVTPRDFMDPSGQSWCAMPLTVGDEAQPVSTTYRLRATAIPVATGEPVDGEVWFTL